MSSTDVAILWPLRRIDTNAHGRRKPLAVHLEESTVFTREEVAADPSAPNTKDKTSVPSASIEHAAPRRHEQTPCSVAPATSARGSPPMTRILFCRLEVPRDGYMNRTGGVHVHRRAVQSEFVARSAPTRAQSIRVVSPSPGSRCHTSSPLSMAFSPAMTPRETAEPPIRRSRIRCVRRSTRRRCRSVWEARRLVTIGPVGRCPNPKANAHWSALR